MKKLVASLLLSVCAFAGIAQAGVIDDAVKRGSLKVGMDPTYMPFEMTNKRGEIIGFEVDILRAMTKAMGVKLELVSTGYDGIIPALMTDKFDMIGSGMTLTQERNLRLNFSDPFIVVGHPADPQGAGRHHQVVQRPEHRRLPHHLQARHHRRNGRQETDLQSQVPRL